MSVSLPVLTIVVVVCRWRRSNVRQWWWWWHDTPLYFVFRMQTIHHKRWILKNCQSESQKVRINVRRENIHRTNMSCCHANLKNLFFQKVKLFVLTGIRTIPGERHILPLNEKVCTPHRFCRVTLPSNKIVTIDLRVNISMAIELRHLFSKQWPIYSPTTVRYKPVRKYENVNSFFGEEKLFSRVCVRTYEPSSK